MKLKISQSIARERLTTKQSGFSLVEIILALAILALLTVALIGNFIYSQESAVVAGAKSRAAFLAEEGLEATRNIRDADFANLVDGNYGLTTSSNQWIFSGTQDVTDIYTRQIQISTPSANRKQIISQVTWQQTAQRTGTVSLTTYLTNWIATVSSIGNWSIPLQQSSLNFAGSQDGWRIKVLGNYAYVVRLDGTPDFLIIDISNLASPSITGSLSLTGIPQDILVSGNYAYIASRDNNQELQIIDISVPGTPTVVGTYNASGNDDGTGLALVASNIYLTRTSGSSELTVINISNPALPTLTGSLNLADTIRDIFIEGNYAFLVSNSNTQELMVADISVPSTPTLLTTLNLSGNNDGATIVGFTSVVLVGRTTSDVVIIDTSNPAAPSVLGTYVTTGTVNDIDVGNSNDYVFLATASTTAEFMVLDIASPATPSRVGFYNTASTLNGVFYDSTLDRAFVVGSNNTTELQILMPS